MICEILALLQIFSFLNIEGTYNIQLYLKYYRMMLIILCNFFSSVCKVNVYHVRVDTV